MTPKRCFCRHYTLFLSLFTVVFVHINVVFVVIIAPNIMILNDFFVFKTSIKYF